MNTEKLLIGRNDLIDFPVFGLKNIKAKIDTGAYTSSIHCSAPKVIEGNPRRLSFFIINEKAKENQNKEFIVNEFWERDIKNSFGQIERRYIIKTKVLLFNKSFVVEFSLSDRSNMKHPVLLGRKFLHSRFIVDVSKFNLSYKEKRKANKKRKLS